MPEMCGKGSFGPSWIFRIDFVDVVVTVINGSDRSGWRRDGSVTVGASPVSLPGNAAPLPPLQVSAAKRGAAGVQEDVILVLSSKLAYRNGALMNHVFP